MKSLSSKRFSLSVTFCTVAHFTPFLHVESPRIINTDKHAVYPKAIEKRKESKELPKTTKHRQVKYLNNILEQDHRFMKRRLRKY